LNVKVQKKLRAWNKLEQLAGSETSSSEDENEVDPKKEEAATSAQTETVAQQLCVKRLKKIRERKKNKKIEILP